MVEKGGTKTRKGWKLVSLTSAEIAFFIAWISYSNSPLSSVISPVVLLPVSVIPALLMLFTDRNPFSFEFFGLLIAMVFPKIFPSTPLYSSFINTVYVLGFENVASYLNSILKPQPATSLPLIVALFCFAQIVEKGKIQYTGVALAAVMLAYLIYPVVFIPTKPAYIAAMLAVGVAAVAFSLFKHS